MENFAEQRKNLILNLIKSGYLKTQNVIKAMSELPREYFVPEENMEQAYRDSPISTFEGQTISAPHMNAMMCELLDLKENLKMLEVGTGSGYHAALCSMVISSDDDQNKGHVYSIERHKKLVIFAQNNLKRAGLENKVTVIHGDGTQGYPTEAQYDRILVTAAGPTIPQPLIDQLKIGGILCIPIGEQRFSQSLMIVRKTPIGIEKKNVCSVVFVPLIGEYGHK